MRRDHQPHSDSNCKGSQREREREREEGGERV